MTSGVALRGEPLKLYRRGAGVLMSPCEDDNAPARALPSVCCVLNIQSGEALTWAAAVRKHLNCLYGARLKTRYLSICRQSADTSAQLYNAFRIGTTGARICTGLTDGKRKYAQASFENGQHRYFLRQPEAV